MSTEPIYRYVKGKGWQPMSAHAPERRFGFWPARQKIPDIDPDVQAALDDVPNPELFAVFLSELPSRIRARERFRPRVRELCEHVTDNIHFRRKYQEFVTNWNYECYQSCCFNSRLRNVARFWREAGS